MNITKFIILIFLVLLVIGGSAYLLLYDEEEGPLNLVLISIDTLRADRLGCYGYDKPTSPNIDRLADESWLFTDAISQSSWTVPSHISILTSLYPGTHKIGVIERSLDERIVTLAQILKENGYRTAGFVDAKFMSKRYGFGRGFDIYKNANGNGIKKVLPPAEKWLEENYRKPFFLFLHVFDCHCPYDPPEEFSRLFSPDYRGELKLKDKCGNPHLNKMELSEEDLRYISQQYDGEVRYVDTELQKFFDLLTRNRLWKDTVLVLISDHGEEFKEHGRIGHQRSVYNELMHVPLLLRLPGKAPEGGTICQRVETIDVMPTVLGLLGIDPGLPLQGKDLLPLIRRGEKVKGGEAFGELNELAVKRTVYLGDYQYIHDPDEGTEELYLLEEDPKEQVNLALKNPEKCRELKAMIDLREERNAREGEDYRAGKVKLDSETRDQLRNLGYVE